jgi:hypothetical protein
MGKFVWRGGAGLLSLTPSPVPTVLPYRPTISFTSGTSAKEIAPAAHATALPDRVLLLGIS